MLDLERVEEACDELQGVLIILAEAAHDLVVPAVAPDRRLELMTTLGVLGRAIVYLSDAAVLLSNQIGDLGKRPRNTID